jgi:hypothetical protein
MMNKVWNSKMLKNKLNRLIQIIFRRKVKKIKLKVKKDNWKKKLQN